ncbi:MAG: LysR family transcriptional regulator [Actinomycetota bacterium]|nr:LysR family transcriptional regulator [Actinomycetota bacterium]
MAVEIYEKVSLDLDALRILTLIADSGSISAAARKEQISQPSASKRIRLLERQLHLELLERRTQGSVLTAHGLLVTQWSRGVVDAVDQLVTGSRALASVGERMCIAASQTIAEYLVPSWLSQFHRKAGRPAVKLKVANSQEVITAVRCRAAELGFVETPYVPADLSSRRVATDQLALVVSPLHPLVRRRRALSPRDLAAMPLVSREGGSGTRESLRRALGQEMAEPEIELESNSAIKILVASGEYAAVLSELVVDAELRDGRLVRIPVRDLDLRRALRAVWRRESTPDGPSAEFLDLAILAGAVSRR